MKLLLEWGADINACTTTMQTPLILAAENGCWTAVRCKEAKLSESAVSEPSRRDEQGMAYFHHAAQ